MAITSNIQGLQYALKRGCEPKLFVEVISQMKKAGKVSIIGKFNRQSTNIHRIDEYIIELA